MSRRRIDRVWRIALGALLVAAVAMGGGSRPAIAAGATVSETGWWSRGPGTATPAGGFQVAKTIDGDLSVAALRITIEGRLTKALLVVKEAPGGFRTDAAAIDVCPTSAPWTAAAPGELEDAPEADCATKVALERNAAAGSWTADLLPVLQDAAGTASVVLTPGSSAIAPLPVDPGFTVEFSAAQLDAAGIDGDADGATSSSGGPQPSASSGSIASDGGSSSTFAGSGGDGRGPASSSSSAFSPTFSAVDTFVAPSLTPQRDVLPAATPDVAAGGAGGAGTAASVESGLQPVAVAATRGEPVPWERLLFIVPLAIAIGAFGTGIRRQLTGHSSRLFEGSVVGNR